jgi:GH24 family phage-related lysozyme (muramidase)
MLPPLASLDQLEIRLGDTLEGADAARAEGNLEDASALVRATARDDFVDEDEQLVDVPDIITSVTLSVAARAYRNPDGVRSEGIGDYQVTYAGFGAGIYLTEAEQDLVKQASRRLGVWSLATTRGELETGTIWIPVEGDVDPFPMLAVGDFGT